jgi:hypothetical protein
MTISDKEHRLLVQSVSRETAKAVSKNVAEKAVRETLISVGIDPSNPLEAQETQANMRKIAALAPSLTSIACMYEDQETREAIQFAKGVHGAYKSGRNRAFAGFGAATITVWVTGLWNKITDLIG